HCDGVGESRMASTGPKDRAGHFVQVQQRVGAAMSQVHKVRNKQTHTPERREVAPDRVSKWPSSQ
ncbi:MAG: hypothetical protein OXH09_15570, partial [Gammaproteobacteria bacterium]|nr:hypothetical protein [Gammaproteobacteria bacterium]